MQKRPTDITIYISRIIFGLILIGTLYYNLIIQGDSLETEYIWLFENVSEQSTNILKYIIIGLGIIPVIMGIVKICVLKKKHMRMVQALFGILLFYISSKIVPSDLNKLDVDSLIAFMGIFPLIAGITGKCITSNCMKFAEKITKIRI